MLSTARSRAICHLTRRTQYASARRGYALSTKATSKTNELPIETAQQDARIAESLLDGEKVAVSQAPNRTAIWSKSQNPKAKAMSGPRFEQTTMELQPAPEAAINLIHKQPVRWTHDRMVECNGGGGALGHPKIFINTDKPQICMCDYCGLPFANEHHRKHLESLPAESLPYPLAP